MKVAVPIENKSLDANVGQSFGLAPYILVYNSITKECEYLDHTEAMTETASGVRAARAIVDNGSRVLLTPGCGANSEKIFKNAEVVIYKSLPGTAGWNIEAFLSDKLSLLTEFHTGIRRKERDLLGEDSV